jgi:hypothetical protein
VAASRTDEDGRVIAGVNCAEVADALPALVDGDRVDKRVARHVDSCLRCQAELANYRKLLRALRTLRTDLLEPPAGGVAGVLAHLAESSERKARWALLTGHKAAYLGGAAAAATAIGAGAAIVLATRRRRAA